MRSYGAPPHLSHLNREWRIDASAPVHNGRSQWVTCDDDVSARLFCSACGQWMIVIAAIPVALANSSAEHPRTIYDDEWVAVTHIFPIRTERIVKFRMTSTISKDGVVDLHDEGMDLFMRYTISFPVSYRDPDDGTVVHHTSCKCIGDLRAGTRYCSICRRHVSANNFVSQHLNSVHYLPPPRLWGVARLH